MAKELLPNPLGATRILGLLGAKSRLNDLLLIPFIFLISILLIIILSSLLDDKPAKISTNSITKILLLNNLIYFIFREYALCDELFLMSK